MKTQERKRVLQYFLFTGILLLFTAGLRATNAPVATVATVCNAVENQQVTVPITVTGFTNIGGFTLTLDYDYSKLHFVKALSTNNPDLGGTCAIGEIDMGGGIRRVVISWYRSGSTGVTLPDGTAIANYVFTYISGPADLTWFDMGPSCVFNDPDANTLTDTPTSTYYINGSISGSCLNVPTITPDGPTSFCEGGQVTLTASDGVYYKWSTGETTKSITVESSGSYSVEVTDGGGATETSAPTVVTVLPLPLAPAAGVTPEFVIGSGQVVFSATSITGTVKWFDAPSGGNEITVLNPVISQTTTYYAEAISDAGCASLQRTAVTATVISVGTTQLSFRLTSPRIIQSSGNNYFEFDVQVKADVDGTYLWEGNLTLDFNNSTLSTDIADWSADAIDPFNGKYSTELTMNGSSVNIACKGDLGKEQMPASPTDFTEITTNYQTLATVRGKISNNSGIAGIHFNETLMNGNQFYKLSDSPWYESYANPNEYEPANFIDTYVGRVYSDDMAPTKGTKSAKAVAIWPGWTQVNALNWSTSVNTSVWNGDAEIPGGSLALASNLRIHEPATLSIPVDGEMSVAGETDIQNTNGLVMLSDATGTGSFITNTASGAGSATVMRYMTTGAWHIVTSPVSGESISEFLSSNMNVGTDANFEATDPDAIRGMMDYNPELNQWNDYFTNSTSGTLSTGKGFCIRTNTNSAVAFTGNLRVGAQAVNGLSPEYWNCVGNPYTSAIGINNLSESTMNFLDENVSNLDPSYGAIYVWDNADGNNGLPGKYTIISNTPTDAAFEVQQGQAFMVKMKTGISSLIFEPGMQIHEPSLSLKSTHDMWPTIKLDASVNLQKASTIIAFNNEMTKGLDPTYDVGLFKGGSDLDIYSRLVEDNGVSFAIQALPADEYNSLVIPIGIDCKKGGEVVFSSELFNLPAKCKVILEDKSSQTFTDLSTNEYKVTIPENASISDRFLLHTSYLTTGFDQALFNGQLSAYAIRNVEIRVKGHVSSQAVATLYDIQGRTLLVKNLEGGSVNTIRIPNIRTGIYVLFVKDKDKLQGFKIPVKE